MIGELFNGNILTRNLLEFILNELMNGQTHQDLVSILQLAYTVNDRLAKGPSADTIFIPIDPSQMDTERKFGRRVRINSNLQNNDPNRVLDPGRIAKLYPTNTEGAKTRRKPSCRAPESVQHCQLFFSSNKAIINLISPRWK